MSWINWKVQNCVIEADCCWSNLYFKGSFHIFWPLCFQMASYNVQMLPPFILKMPFKELKGQIVSIPHKHRANQNKKISGSFITEQSEDSNVCYRFNIWLKHDEQPYKKGRMLFVCGVWAHPSIYAHCLQCTGTVKVYYDGNLFLRIS